MILSCFEELKPAIFPRASRKVCAVYSSSTLRLSFYREQKFCYVSRKNIVENGQIFTSPAATKRLVEEVFASKHRRHIAWPRALVARHQRRVFWTRTLVARRLRQVFWTRTLAAGYLRHVFWVRYGRLFPPYMPLFLIPLAVPLAVLLAGSLFLVPSSASFPCCSYYSLYWFLFTGSPSWSSSRSSLQCPLPLLDLPCPWRDVSHRSSEPGRLWCQLLHLWDCVVAWEAG